MLKGIVRTSYKNLSLPTTLALLMLIFCKLVPYESRNKMAMTIYRDKMKVFRKKPEFQTTLHYMKMRYEKATSRLVGHILWLHKPIGLKIKLGTAEYLLFYLLQKS